MSIFSDKNDKTNDIFYDTDDVLVVFDDDNKTCDIRYISSIDKDTIIVDGRYAVPIGDTEITTGEIGRVYFYRAPSRSVKETQRLAALEKSIVLTKITQYNPPEDDKGINLITIVLSALLFVALMILAFK